MRRHRLVIGLLISAPHVLLGRVSLFNNVDEQPQVRPDRRRYIRVSAVPNR